MREPDRPGALRAPPYAISDPARFARNLTKAVEEGSRALSAYVDPVANHGVAEATKDQTFEVMKTLGEVAQYWLTDQARLMDAYARLWSSYMTVSTNTMLRFWGVKPSQTIEPRAGDRRFKDEEWTSSPFYDALKQLYLATSYWAQDMVDEAQGIDPHVKHKARFYVDQMINALSPANFAITNPEVLRETAETNGENFVRGMRMLAEDLAAGDGQLKLRQSDASRFTVGENLASTPGKVIHRNALCEIIQYKATTSEVLKVPLLIVPPWINKYYILDLTPEKSFIKWAVDQGHTVFVISWVNPGPSEADKDFESYMREGILKALEIVETATGEKEVNAIGYCVGGTLLAFTLAYLAGRNERPIRTATLFTAQVDFTYAGDLKIFADEAYLSNMEREMQERGYLEGGKMAAAFNLLRSNDLIWPYIVNNYLKGKEPPPFDLLYWNSDATRMPCANHSYYLRNCYVENNLSRGRLVVDNVRLDLGRIDIPVYNLATKEDHIAPARSVFYGSRFFGGPVEYVLSGSGHIAGVVNPPEKRKYQHWVNGPPEGELQDWLAHAEERPGSWWPHWQAWIEDKSDERIKKRKIGGGRLKGIEKAPGSYVRVTS